MSSLKDAASNLIFLQLCWEGNGDVVFLKHDGNNLLLFGIGKLETDGNNDTIVANHKLSWINQNL